MDVIGKKNKQGMLDADIQDQEKWVLRLGRVTDEDLHN
jgi:hypothetical protein